MSAAPHEVLAPAAEPVVFRRVQLRAQRRVRWMRHLWSGDGAPAQGFVISDTEVDRILGGPQWEREAERAFYEREDTGAIVEVEASFARDERTARLRDALGLTPPELDLLSLAVSVAYDPWMRRVCGYLHDDATLNGATPWLAAALFGWERPWLFGAESMLTRWQLAAPIETPAGPQTIWTADPHIAAWWCSLDCGGRSRRFPSAQTLDLHADELEDALTFVKALEGTAIELHLNGPRGSGRRSFAQRLCARLDRELLFASTPDNLTEIVRTAKLENAAIYIAADGEWPAPAWDTVRAGSSLVIVGGEAKVPAPKAALKTIALRPLVRAARIAMWERVAGTPAPHPIAEWSLTAGEITAAARVARAGTRAVAEACRTMLQGELPDLLAPMPLPYEWHDIVLAAQVRAELEAFGDEVRLRGAVYDDWGFARLTPLGRGSTALFAGPSGTGKTMAAQVIARAADLPLYRVDLSGVVNKYIGETEKRLKKIFDACTRADAVLFFDEADALFGQRMQVREAHDRFANIEIDYLLQRMEQFDGVAILATNRRNDLDTAFLRRLRVTIDFPSPGRDERLALWHRALHEKSPAGELLLDALDWDYLAEKLSLTGAEIKSAALTAAFRARASGSRIGMRQLVAAARRELAKRDAILREPEWEE